jgi:hypothetical protein
MIRIDAQIIFEDSGEGQEDPQTGVTVCSSDKRAIGPGATHCDEGVSPSAVREERFE